MRELSAEGKGEYTYDYDNDILLFKIKDRDYKKSIDFGNIIVDIDTEEFITGVRIFDASKVFGLNKYALKVVQHFKLHAGIEDRVVTLQLEFVPVFRNRPLLKQGQHLIREADINVEDAEVLATVA